MHEQLGGDGAVVEALRAASDRARLLGVPELKILSGALTPLDLVWQVVEHAKQTNVDRAELLSLLDDGRVRAELIIFLRRELQTLTPCAATPELSASEMMSLFALLHPVRDIVRQIVPRTAVDPQEDILLDRTVDAIYRLGFGFPPPKPDADQTARRPGWVSALSEIPGWEHWRCMKVPA
jgi:hypothetical protein